jgi:beta-glucosidase
VGFCGNSTRALVSNYVNQFCPGGGDACFPSIAQAIAALGEGVATARGCASATECSPADIAAAAALAAAPGTARTVLCLGISQAEEAEQHDRVNITLPEPQRDLVAAVLGAAPGKPLAVVLVHGGALAVPELKAAPGVGILDAFYPGPAGGGAIADALFGAYNPGGKLPYTVYDAGYAAAVDMADMRIAETGRTYRYNAPGVAGKAPGGPPLWPFGYGTSYTTFSVAYSGAPSLLLTPASPTAALPLRLTNTGALAGDEVVQVYIAADAGSLAAPAPPYVAMAREKQGRTQAKKMSKMSILR